jgi:hypothetical protein
MTLNLGVKYTKAVDLKWGIIEKKTKDTWVCKTSRTVASRLSREVLA